MFNAQELIARVEELDVQPEGTITDWEHTSLLSEMTVRSMFNPSMFEDFDFPPVFRNLWPEGKKNFLLLLQAFEKERFDYLQQPEVTRTDSGDLNLVWHLSDGSRFVLTHSGIGHEFHWFTLHNRELQWWKNRTSLKEIVKAVYDKLLMFLPDSVRLRIAVEGTLSKESHLHAHLASSSLYDPRIWWVVNLFIR